MKKLVFLIMVLALMAGSNQIFAQAIGGSAPRPLSCDITNPFTPIAGIPYDYSATVDPADGTAYWYATLSTTFMSGGAITATQEAIGGTYVEAATNYMTAANVPPPSPGTTTTSITWTTGGLANVTVPPTDPPELFVVVNYTAPATGCANNMKVYPIRPFNAFTVDITNIEDATKVPLAYDVAEDQCAPGVVSAQWINTPTPDGSVDYDFGADTLYFEVIAANFTDSYDPTYQISGLIGDQTADLDWGYAIGTYPNNITTGSGNGTYPDGTVTTTVQNTSTGVSIYVRMIVHNNDTEGLAAIPITLAVDAVNAAGQPDVAHDDCLENGFEDLAMQTVNPRPAVNAVAPGVFLPVAP